MSAEPKVTITEGDRRSAAKAMSWSGDNAKRWVETGFPAGARSFKAIDLAYAIARARAMAAFEERCAAVMRFLYRLPADLWARSMSGEKQIYTEVIADVAGVSFDAADKFRAGNKTDDDIRELVLKGWP